MNKQEFISSGVLENFVLGIATSEEIKQIREMEKLYPEITKEIEEIEASIIRYAEGQSDAPSIGLKKKITNELFRSFESEEQKNVVVDFEQQNKTSTFLRYAVAASIALLIGSAVLNFSLNNKLTKNQKELAQLRSEKDTLAHRYEAQQSILISKNNELTMMMKPGNKLVPLKGLDLSPGSSAMIVWNPKDKQVFINVASLPMPPAGMQYQLWALVDGKPVDAGVFTMTNGEFVMQKMKDMDNAQAFAVTLEKAGGSPSPDMKAMYLMGEV